MEPKGAIAETLQTQGLIKNFLLYKIVAFQLI